MLILLIHFIIFGEFSVKPRNVYLLIPKMERLVAAFAQSFQFESHFGRMKQIRKHIITGRRLMTFKINCFAALFRLRII